MTKPALATVLLAGLLLSPAVARAEPWIALEAGLKCAACHVNPTGGGKRTEFGAQYAARELAAEPLPVATEGGEKDGLPLWTGRVNEYFHLGGDMRTSNRKREVPNQNNTNAFALDEALLYFEFSLLPGRFTLYVDEQLGPGAALNREAYLLLRFNQQQLYVKAGRMFLPYGLRLVDDSAFIRQTPGINFTTPDSGVEAGLDHGPWSAALAVTNGTAGGSEVDSSKQVSVLATYTQSWWRLGASTNHNRTGQATRRLANLFLGVKLGRVGLLAEWDRVLDTALTTARREQQIGFIEANMRLWRGQNLKLTHEYLDPDRSVSEDERTRNSVVWEYFFWPYSQLRLGYRRGEGIPQNNLQNARDIFVELHAYF